jgi:DNA-binding MarR family transcriptional regulator
MLSPFRKARLKMSLIDVAISFDAGLRAVRAALRPLTRGTRAQDIDLSSLLTLASIGTGPMPVNTLIADGHYLKSTLSTTLKTLAKAGYLTIRRDDVDGRRRVVELTKAGIALVRVMRARAATINLHLLEVGIEAGHALAAAIVVNDKSSDG